MQYLIAYAFEFVGTPYKWGGSTKEGIDCSGLTQEILASVGMDPQGDQNAQMLYNIFLPLNKDNTPKPGALCFYGKSVKEITHVAFMLDRHRILEAGGGGIKVVDRESAEKAQAFVRVRLYNRRKDLVAVLNPNYPEWMTHG